MAKKGQHYVNNKDFHAAMLEYKAKVVDAEMHGEPRPRVTPYIGDCIMKIAYRLSLKPNFINYSFREEMISDGIENCLQYIDNFNPEKYNNPFAYFTQIIYYAFLRRIAKEKKQMYTKYKITEQMDVMNLGSENQMHDGTDYRQPKKLTEWDIDHVGRFIEDFEENKRKKKKNKNTTAVDKLMESD